MIRAALVLAGMAMLFAGAAEASQQGVQAMINWKNMDKCAQTAQAAFPDYTADSNAKRDARLKDCLNSGNLPPRPDLSPSRQ